MIGHRNDETQGLMLFSKNSRKKLHEKTQKRYVRGRTGVGPRVGAWAGDCTHYKYEDRQRLTNLFFGFDARAAKVYLLQERLKFLEATLSRFQMFKSSR